ncbi:Unknown protein, partial [Striga hermonthica]
RDASSRTEHELELPTQPLKTIPSPPAATPERRRPENQRWNLRIHSTEDEDVCKSWKNDTLGQGRRSILSRVPPPVTHSTQPLHQELWRFQVEICEIHRNSPFPPLSQRD